MEKSKVKKGKAEAGPSRNTFHLCCVSLLVVSALLLALGCTVKNTEQPAETRSVYVAGAASTSNDIIGFTPCYWKDNVPVSLEKPVDPDNPDVEISAMAFGVYFANNKVYVPGRTDPSWPSDGYWEDGTWHWLEGFKFPGVDNFLGLNAAYFSDTDMYFVGERAPLVGSLGPKGLLLETGYYKNDEWHTLDTGDSVVPAHPLGITVSGDNVYVYGCYQAIFDASYAPNRKDGELSGGGLNMGSDYQYLDEMNACYWKNDEFHAITDVRDDYTQPLIATSLYADDDDFYITGMYRKDGATTGYTSGYWHNGVWSQPLEAKPSLTSDSYPHFPLAFIKDGTDTYVPFVSPGDEMGRGIESGYFKNGIKKNLLPQNGIAPIAFAMFKDNADLYFACNYVSDTASTGGYWKNDTWTKLASPSADLTNTLALSVTLH